MFIKEFISDTVPVLDSEHLFLFALTLMDELKISSLPVVDEGVYKGLLPENAIYELDLFDQSILEHEHLLKPISLRQDQTILDAVNLFVQESTDILPIVDELGNYQGALTKTDALKIISKLIAAGEQGGILALRMNYNDLCISDISKVIENEDANIINLFVSPVPSSTEINIFIKINKVDLTRIERSLQRHNYDVMLLSENKEFDESLSLKYDLFMKYLDI